ncbi:MAG: penicillin amidase, partial [Actinomycetota bacterium]|nr:penicillin amidase [Actinomycetota bacterium]
REVRYGVPSVYAAHMPGVWFGTGWAQAEDRLFQIELVRRNARGSLAELFGSFDSSTIDADKQSRTFFYTDAELQSQFDSLPAWVRSGARNFVAGLNAYVEHAYASPASRAQLVPFQFWTIGLLRNEEVYKPPPFTVLDVIANGNFLGREFGGGGGDELSNLSFLQFLQGKYGAQEGYAIFNDARWVDDPTAPVTVPDGRPQYGVGGGTHNPVPPAPGFLTPSAGDAQGGRNDPPPAVVEAGARARRHRQDLLESIGTRYHVPWKDGSNSWVVSPKKTTNGHAFLWGGPQEGFDSPSIDWEIYQHGPGFDVGGFTIPLAPIVLIGRNKDVAFTTTSEETVDQQIYQEHADFSHNPPTYRFKGKNVPMQAVAHVIKVAGQPDQTFVSYRTVHGPVFFTDPAQHLAYAMKFASFGQEWKTFVGFALQSTARNLHDYRRAMSKIATLHNFFYADRRGNIAYFGAGLVPRLKPCPNLRRLRACDPRLPHNGDGSEEWLGTVPFDAMPSIVNPKQGYLVNWNTKPSTAHYLQQNGGEEYWGTIYHSEPIARDLAAKHKLSPRELTAIEADIGTIDDADSRPAAPYFLPRLFRAYEHARALHTPQRDRAIAALRAWDQRTTIGSVAMSINTQWMQALEQRVFGANGVVPFADGNQDFVGKATFNLLWHVLDRTRGLVPCNRLCADVDYFGGHRNAILIGALDDAIALLSGTGVLPGTHGAHGFGTNDITQWGWVPAQNKDWSDLDPVANAAADLGLLQKPALGTSPTQNRSTWMQAMDVAPSGIRGVAVLPPGESGFISKDGTFSPHFNDQVPLFNDFRYKSMPLAR